VRGFAEPRSCENPRESCHSVKRLCRWCGSRTGSAVHHDWPEHQMCGSWLKTSAGCGSIVQIGDVGEPPFGQPQLDPQRARVHFSCAGCRNMETCGSAGVPTRRRFLDVRRQPAIAVRAIARLSGRPEKNARRGRRRRRPTCLSRLHGNRRLRRVLETDPQATP